MPVFTVLVVAAAVTWAFYFGMLFGGQNQQIVLSLKPPSEESTVTSIQGDPFVEKHSTTFLGGTVSALYAPSRDDLLVSFAHLPKPPSGYGVLVSGRCDGETFNLGLLSSGYFGDSGTTPRNSCVMTHSSECDRILTQKTRTGDEGKQSVVWVAPAWRTTNPSKLALWIQKGEEGPTSTPPLESY